MQPEKFSVCTTFGPVGQTSTKIWTRMHQEYLPISKYRAQNPCKQYCRGRDSKPRHADYDSGRPPPPRPVFIGDLGPVEGAVANAIANIGTGSCRGGAEWSVAVRCGRVSRSPWAFCVASSSSRRSRVPGKIISSEARRGASAPSCRAPHGCSPTGRVRPRAWARAIPRATRPFVGAAPGRW